MADTEEKRVDWCASCNILKTEYPDFVMNGLNEEMCANLANNQGLDETKCVNNCEVMHDIADCLIGGFIESIDTYDVCETKEMMKHFATNMMNVIDVLLCSHCGQWEQIEAIWDEITGIHKRIDDVIADLQNNYYTKDQIDDIFDELEQKIQDAKDYMFGANFDVEMRFLVIDGSGDPTITTSVEKTGDFVINETDWIEQGTNPFGYRTMTGNVDFCMIEGSQGSAVYRVNSLTLDRYVYDATGNAGAATAPSFTVRSPNENGTVLYTIQHASGVDVDVNVDTTATVGVTGTLDAGETTDWITVMNIYADWVVDSSVNLQIRFINNNSNGAVPVCD